MSTEIMTLEPTSIARREELTVDDLVAQVHKIQDMMSKVMKNNEHFGVIPGTNKPTLLKPGAEKLCLLFRLDPQYEAIREWDGPHLSVTSVCTLYHITSGQRMGSGMGSCSTKEAKYAWRKGERTCPECGAASIIKGKSEYGGGWLCWSKKGGCGAKFADGYAPVDGQLVGRIPNEDLPDAYNTVLKMSNKRSLIAAVLNVTGASDIFTQDMEDAPSVEVQPVAQEPQAPTERQKLTAEIAAVIKAQKIPEAEVSELKTRFFGEDRKNVGIENLRELLEHLKLKPQASADPLVNMKLAGLTLSERGFAPAKASEMAETVFGKPLKALRESEFKTVLENLTSERDSTNAVEQESSAGVSGERNAAG